MSQPKGKSAAQLKRPSRRHRRRPGNLLQDYIRRQNTHVWLETHIWHAKRFHMADEWGYRIPLHPNDKGVRAAYRATVHHCLLQVCMYCGPVEWSSSLNKSLVLDVHSYLSWHISKGFRLYTNSLVCHMLPLASMRCLLLCCTFASSCRTCPVCAVLSCLFTGYVMCCVELLIHRMCRTCAVLSCLSTGCVVHVLY